MKFYLATLENKYSLDEVQSDEHQSSSKQNKEELNSYQSSKVPEGNLDSCSQMINYLQTAFSAPLSVLAKPDKSLKYNQINSSSKTKV